MRQYTNRALLISLGLHLILTVMVVPILVQPSDEIRDSSAVSLLEVKPVQRVRQRILRQYQPPIRQNPQAKLAKPSAASLASPTNTVRGPAPQAPCILMSLLPWSLMPICRKRTPRAAEWQSRQRFRWERCRGNR